MINSCPSCGGALLNEFVPTKNGKEFLKKSCAKKIGHIFSIRSKIEDHQQAEAIFVTVDMGQLTTAVWNVLNKELFITPYRMDQKYSINKIYKLPYIDPDLSDYNRLVARIKTYILFS